MCQYPGEVINMIHVLLAFILGCDPSAWDFCKDKEDGIHHEYSTFEKSWSYNHSQCKNHQPDGLWMSFEHSRYVVTCQYCEGVLCNASENYIGDKLVEKSTLSRWKKTEVYQYFLKNGQIEFAEFYQNDCLVLKIEYYPNGNRKALNIYISQPEPIILFQLWSPEGFLMLSGTALEDKSSFYVYHGPVIQWTPSGQWYNTCFFNKGQNANAKGEILIGKEGFRRRREHCIKGSDPYCSSEPCFVGHPYNHYREQIDTWMLEEQEEHMRFLTIPDDF
jgi:hypothetical protein